MIIAGIKTVITVYIPILNSSEILIFINIAIANNIFEIIDIKIYLLNLKFPLL